MDIKLRYQKRMAKQEELAGRYQWELFVVHLASGGLSIVTVELGAKLIVDGSHREATPEEVALHQEHQRREGERIASHGRMIAGINHRPGDREPDPNGRGYEFI